MHVEARTCTPNLELQSSGESRTEKRRTLPENSTCEGIEKRKKVEEEEKETHTV